jgi:hypothetical protein
MVLLDLEKAYDTVWIHGLLNKLIVFKLPTYRLFTLKAFLEGRSYTVHLNHTSSSPNTAPSSLSQGAVSSTTLFALYISDMPQPPNTKLALYADDTAILVQSWWTDTIVQRLINPTSILLRYFTRWKHQVNIHKTEANFFIRRRPVPPVSPHFQRTVIQWNSQVRYFCLPLDPKIQFTRHLTSVTQKATGIFRQILPFLARDSTLSIHNKITLYKLFIRSVLTYAAPDWSNTPSSNYRRLQILQSKCLCVIGNIRRRTPIPRLHTALNVAPIRDFIYHLTDNFFGIWPAHPNPLVLRSIRIYTLADLHRQYKKYIHKRPMHLLP